MQKFMIIDGSSIFYRAFYAMPPLTAPSGEPTGAVTGFANIILKLLREYNPDIAAVALDKSRKTFRTEIFSEYKGTRDKMPDELGAQIPLFETFCEVVGLKMISAENFEADDIIGTLAAQAGENFFVEIVTGDRDALQLINSSTRVLLTKNTKVEVYDEKKFVEEYNFEPKKLVDFKGLSGDNSDNIPGVAGIGSKTASKLLQDFGDVENILANVEEIKSKKVRESLKNSSEVALMSKKLAKIICDVPNVTFDAENFSITPNLKLADEFCSKYALNVAKKRIHELFDTNENLFGEFAAEEEIFEVLQAPEIIPVADMEKIFSAESLAVADNLVKIFDGEIFFVDEVQLEKIFGEYKNKIVVSDAKKIFKTRNFSENIFDVGLAAYLIYPERENYFYDELLSIEFEGLKLSEKSTAGEVTALEKLGRLYEKKLDEENLKKLFYEIELPLAEVLAKMELRGVFVDLNSLEKKSAEMETQLSEIEKNIYTFAGETFNINSPKQLAEILFEKLKLPPVKNTRTKTKSGISTNAEVLEALKNQHQIVPEILNFRMLTKLKSTYLDGIKNLINPKTHRVHTNFNQTVTATGRLSSSDPNLQNIPVRTEEGRKIRGLFEPGEGFDFLLSADYSQIELRLLAHMSDDENLINAFLSGEDIHARTAAEVFGVEISEVTADLRRKAKAVNFGIVYGISDYGLSLDLHTTRKEAGEYIQLYFERYPKVKNFLDETISQAKKFGYVSTMFGRKRYLPAIKSPNFHQRGLAERMAMNTPIQGSAADIIKLAMIHAEKNLQGLQSRIILQVHDELVAEVKSEELEQVEKILRDSMENVVKLKIPLVVDVHSGKNWAEAK
ncbi:MAG: DNA polymerase I [Selenomonadaceae bacterium]|nr:DNA polymerase I [Selenomonadaceae bacterium]